MLKAALQHVRACRERGIDVDIEVAGKKAINFFKFQKMDLQEQHSLGDVPAYEAVEKIASSFIRRYVEGQYDSVHIVYTQFISNARQQAVESTAADVSPEADGDSAEAVGEVVYDFQPSVDELLDDLLPLMAKTVLFQAFNDAAVSEHIMRMIAMKAATEFQGSRPCLRQQFNRARQVRSPRN